jgi:hypothetical protein
MAKSGLMTDIIGFIEAGKCSSLYFKLIQHTIVQSNRSEVVIELFCESLFMWKIMSSYGIQVESIQRVGFLLELVQNWSPTNTPDIAVCFSFLI